MARQPELNCYYQKGERAKEKIGQQQLSWHMYEVERIIIEVVSAVLYFTLVRYMYKPYSLTGEKKYLGLPLGFAFLGISEIFLTIQIIYPSNYQAFRWPQGHLRLCFWR